MIVNFVAVFVVAIAIAVVVILITEPTVYFSHHSDLRGCQDNFLVSSV